MFHVHSCQSSRNFAKLSPHSQRAHHTALNQIDKSEDMKLRQLVIFLTEAKIMKLEDKN